MAGDFCRVRHQTDAVEPQKSRSSRFEIFATGLIIPSASRTAPATSGQAEKWANSAGDPAGKVETIASIGGFTGARVLAQRRAIA
jgi:hypothetical protein